MNDFERKRWEGWGNGRGWLFNVLAVIIVLTGTSCVGRSRDLPPEWYGVGTLTRAVVAYAEAHDSRLPTALDDVSKESIALREGLTIDMFIYVAPKGSTTNLPSDTPIVVFPWEEGIIVGYLNGHKRFLKGGYGHERWNDLQRSLVGWKLAFGGLFWVCVISAAVAMHRKSKRKLSLLEGVTFGVLMLIISGYFVSYVVLSEERGNRDLINQKEPERVRL